MIFELAQNVHDAAVAMPHKYFKHRMLELLDEAIPCNKSSNQNNKENQTQRHPLNFWQTESVLLKRIETKGVFLSIAW